MRTSYSSNTPSSALATWLVTLFSVYSFLIFADSLLHQSIHSLFWLGIYIGNRSLFLIKCKFLSFLSRFRRPLVYLYKTVCQCEKDVVAEGGEVQHVLTAGLPRRWRASRVNETGTCFDWFTLARSPLKDLIFLHTRGCLSCCFPTCLECLVVVLRVKNASVTQPQNPLHHLGADCSPSLLSSFSFFSSLLSIASSAFPSFVLTTTKKKL